MISRTSRTLSWLSNRSLTTSSARPACFALHCQITAAPKPIHSRAKSTVVQRSPLHSVPSKAEAVGKPAVDTKKGKVWESAHEAVKDIKSGSLILSSGQYPSHLPPRISGSLTSRIRPVWYCRDNHCCHSRNTVHHRLDCRVQ